MVLDSISVSPLELMDKVEFKIVIWGGSIVWLFQNVSEYEKANHQTTPLTLDGGLPWDITGKVLACMHILQERLLLYIMAFLERWYNKMYLWSSTANTCKVPNAPWSPLSFQVTTIDQWFPTLFVEPHKTAHFEGLLCLRHSFQVLKYLLMSLLVESGMFD